MENKPDRFVFGGRNRGIDLIRAGCVLLIMIYHLYSLVGFPHLPVAFFQRILYLGGEIGVTGFFMLSGYGMYCSLDRQQETGTFSYGAYLKKRAWRILPQYYANIFLLLFLSYAVRIDDMTGLCSLGRHLLFLQGFTAFDRGLINGVLWSVSIIVQFYLIAPFLYKILKRWNFILIGAAGGIFTIGCKFLLLHYTQLDSFLASRQLFTSLDNFLLGMCLAAFWQRQKKRLHPGIAVPGCIAMIFVMGKWCRSGMRYGIHSDNLSGYIWHTVMALILVLLFGLFMQLPVREKNPFNKAVLWIGKYEYGIFLWHLCIEEKAVSGGFFAFLCNRGLFVPAVLLLFAGIFFFSWFMTTMIDKCFVPWLQMRWGIINKENNNG